MNHNQKYNHQRMPARARAGQIGSVTSEYLVVSVGLLIVWVGIDIVLNLIREHNRNYSAHARAVVLRETHHAIEQVECDSAGDGAV